MEVEESAQPAIPENMEELLAHIQREWQALQATVAAASEADLLRPGPEVWSPKDHLAHVASWLDVLQKHYLGGQSFAEATGIDLSKLSAAEPIDGVNAIFFERNKNLTVAQVRAWLERKHAEILAHVQGMSFSDLMRSYEPDNPEARLLILEVMANTNEHYQEHNHMIKALLERP